MILQPNQHCLDYMAHKYTERDPDGNFVLEAENANFTICNINAGKLLDLGYNIYSPISHTHPIHTASPIFLARREHELWYHLDNEFIDICPFRSIILTPRWELSSGCVNEVIRFLGLGRMVAYFDGNNYPELMTTEELKKVNKIQEYLDEL